ncbi:MAG TPA: class I SAM-dependent methyltransferase [Spirochaetota bacterium]|nr:class I SAM-dependent methyltransferase [Spirochaetota bacterium]HPC40512.1 class I SAM-dependent methyltransferase [Spirochaetota bacterium]HPL18016.1 class I SAM-dependent methyltransferase [Spirochaetota bacterium]HQF07980.1 class I SAM-dependent methyltransferase [Spirochaetota bacterium]HQH96540.1 class I SAM-dependent methyltransferase [Spirochaetota bacterium]
MQIESLLTKAVRKRETLLADAATNCCRLFNGAGDGVPGLTIDRYGDYILMQYFDEGLAPATGDILAAITRVIPLLPERPLGILLKKRLKPDDTRDIASAMKSVVLEGAEPPGGYCVRQNGILAAVDLVGGQSTGIFLDMREVRDRLAGYYRSSDTMLNLFSYTGLFSVHAVRNGITGAVNVDLSKGVLERAKENYRLNGLKVDERDFIYGDSLEWTRRFTKKGKNFTLVIFDPPTFSRNRRRTFSTKKNFQGSLDLLNGLVEDGFVLTSVNSYSITRDEYLSFHPKGWELEFIANESSDFTHGGNPYLKAGLWRIKNS